MEMSKNDSQWNSESPLVGGVYYTRTALKVQAVKLDVTGNKMVMRFEGGNTYEVWQHSGRVGMVKFHQHDLCCVVE
jgi:hypothetical protein